MLKIYGANLSSPSNKVRMAAHVLGIEYEYIPVSIGRGENRKEDHLKLHPAGKVPVIDDDGFVLFESDAIIKYLAVKQKSPLYPNGTRQRALIDQWMDFIGIHIAGAMGKVAFNRLFASFAKIPVDERALSDGLKFIGRFLPVINHQLSHSVFLIGENMTLADIALLATLDPAEAAQIDLSPYKYISAWRSRLMKEEFYTKCHASYKESLNGFLTSMPGGAQKP